MRPIILIIIFLAPFFLNSCKVPPNFVKNYYDPSFGSDLLNSKKIKLITNLEENEGKIELILEFSKIENKNILKVKWKEFGKYRPYIEKIESLQIFSGECPICSLNAISEPGLISFNRDPQYFTEQAIYKINDNLIEIINNAENLSFLINGKTKQAKGILKNPIDLSYIKEFLQRTKLK